jgi:hypothetical protein
MDTKFRAQHIGKALLLGKPVSTADRVWTAKLILAATNYTHSINTLCSGEGDYDEVFEQCVKHRGEMETLLTEEVPS